MTIGFKVYNVADDAQTAGKAEAALDIRRIRDITGGSLSSCGHPGSTKTATEAHIRLSFNGDSSFDPVYLHEGFEHINYRVIGLLYNHPEELAVIFLDGTQKKGPFTKTGVIYYTDLPETMEPQNIADSHDFSTLDVLKVVLRAMPGKRTEKEISFMLGPLQRDCNGFVA